MQRKMDTYNITLIRSQYTQTWPQKPWQKRKELREIMAMLRDANLRFWWSSPPKVQVFYKGHSYFIFSEESDLAVLQILNMPKPPRAQRQSVKHKLQLVEGFKKVS